MDTTKLIGHIPDNIYQQVIAIPEIDGPLRMSNFLGQCKLESQGFTHFSENLNYSGDALWTLFPRHFADQAEAETYARQPEKIANRIYANRMGNGDEASGDGWLYKGRGSLQITGKANYEALETWLDEKGTSYPVSSNPDLLLTDCSMISAEWFFTSHNLWVICDKGVDLATVTILTHSINGGDNGLPLRLQYTQGFYNILVD